MSSSTRGALSAADGVAAVVVGIEAVGVWVLVLWQIWALSSGDVADVVSAVALIVLTAVGAAAVSAFAVAIIRDQSWGRSGAIVVQLLILAVAGGALTGEFAHPLVAAALAVPAVLGFVVLVVAVRRSAARRRAAEDDPAAD